MSNLNQEDEMAFQDWITKLPWYKEFQQQYREKPDINDKDYDYRAAYKAGVSPERYAPDNNRYHWPSTLDNGEELKSKDHPTMWANDFMKEYGSDPIELGITHEQADPWGFISQFINKRNNQK